MPAENITNVYNGTDTKKFKRTPEMVRLTPTLTLTLTLALTLALTLTLTLTVALTLTLTVTPNQAVEALKRYPCATPDGAFVVGCIGSYEEREGVRARLRVRVGGRVRVRP